MQVDRLSLVGPKLQKLTNLDLNALKMPGVVDVYPLPPQNCCQPGVARSLLYSGSRFQGHQKSKGNRYDVEVELQVSIPRETGRVCLLASVPRLQSGVGSTQWRPRLSPCRTPVVHNWACIDLCLY